MLPIAIVLFLRDFRALRELPRTRLYAATGVELRAERSSSRASESLFCIFVRSYSRFIQRVTAYLRVPPANRSPQIYRQSEPSNSSQIIPLPVVVPAARLTAVISLIVPPVHPKTEKDRFLLPPRFISRTTVTGKIKYLKKKKQQQHGRLYKLLELAYIVSDIRP